MKKVYIWGIMFSLLFIISGCEDSGSNGSIAREYKVTLKNVTYSQPMSPMVVVHHNKTVSLFKVGEKATIAIERLAEDGNNTAIYMSSTFPKKARGTGDINASKSDSVTLTSTTAYDCISVAAMLVRTNDAFTGINCLDVSTMVVGGKMTKNLISYDAGTEKNSEINTTIPGLKGEGFNATRDDILNKVTIHSGVVTKVGGLSTSSLTEAHRWDNPTATLVVERLK